MAQSGSASGLGPEGPRFESLYPDLNMEQRCLSMIHVWKCLRQLKNLK